MCGGASGSFYQHENYRVRILQYAMDNDRKFPQKSGVKEIIMPYLKDESLFSVDGHPFVYHAPPEGTIASIRCPVKQCWGRWTCRAHRSFCMQTDMSRPCPKTLTPGLRRRGDHNALARFLCFLISFSFVLRSEAGGLTPPPQGAIYIGRGGCWKQHSRVSCRLTLMFGNFPISPVDWKSPIWGCKLTATKPRSPFAL